MAKTKKTDTAAPKRSPFRADIRVGAPGLDPDAMHRLAASEPNTFMARVQDMIDAGEFGWQDVRSLPRLYSTLADVQVAAHFDDIGGQTRAIQTSAFPLLTGLLTLAGLNDRYQAVDTIGQKLVTEMEDNKKVSVVAAVAGLDVDVDTLQEGHDAPEIGATEEHVTIAHKRNGRRLSITAETIEENNVADIVSRVNALGDIVAERVEEQTLRRVCDVDGSGTTPAAPYAYNPAGTGTQLYNSTANNPGTRAPSGTRVNSNVLADESDLDNALAVLAAMKNHRGKRIAIPTSQLQLVVPFALYATAWKIRGSEYASGVENELSAWGPRGAWQPDIVSSTKLDDISTSTWYLGAFPKQFTRKWKLRMEYNTLGENTESYLRARVKFQASVFWDVEIGARDYVWVVQNLSGTTPPS